MDAPHLPGVGELVALGERASSSVFRASRDGAACRVEIVNAPCDARTARRIHRIAVARARATHPSLPKVLAIGTHEGRPYLVTQWVGGQSLEEARARVGLDLVDVAHRIVMALVELHHRGIAHGQLTRDDVRIDDSGSVWIEGGSIGAPRENDFHALGRVLSDSQPPEDQRLKAIITRLLDESAERPWSPLARLLADLGMVEPPRRTEHAALPRQAELDEIGRAWADARAGSGRVVTLGGPHGIGKTTLALRFLSKLPSETTVLRVSAESNDVRPFAAIERIFESYAETLDGGQGSAHTQALAQLGSAVCALDPILATTIGSLASLATAVRRPRSTLDVTHRIAESFAELVIRWSATTPIVLFVDDTESLDAESVRALIRLIARVDDGRVLLLVAGHGSARLTEWAPSRSVVDVAIRPLDWQQTAELVRIELAPSDVAPELQRHIAALSDPTPASTVETTRTLLAEQAIELDLATWRLTRTRGAVDQMTAGLEPVPSPLELARSRARALGAIPERVLDAVSRARRTSLRAVRTELALTWSELEDAVLDLCAEGFVNVDGEQIALSAVPRGAFCASRPARSVEIDGADAPGLLIAGRTALGISALEQAARGAVDPVRRAELWLDLAAYREGLLEPEAARKALTAAFRALSLDPPTARRGSLLAAVTTRLPLFRSAHHSSLDPRLAVAARAYCRAAHLALEQSQPMIAAEAALRALDHAERTEQPSVCVEARMQLALVCINAGMSRAGERFRDGAERLAADHAESLAVFRRLDAVIATSMGDIARAISDDRAVLAGVGEEHEPSDLLDVLLHFQQMEVLRGNPTAAWLEIERALARLRSNPSLGFIPDVIADAARAVLTSLGREGDIDEALFGLVERLKSVPAASRLADYAWGARIRQYSERGELGPAFEQVVAEFERAHPNPRQTSAIAAEYYVHVMHARIHSALRAPQAERARHIGQLSKAVADLDAVARSGLLEAHARVGGAYVALLSENDAAARKAFSHAETLGNGADASWIAYAVARGRARLALRENRNDIVRDQGAMAELVARSTGSAYRLRWIREDLGLPASTSRTRSDAHAAQAPSAERVLRPLEALREVSEAQHVTLTDDRLLASMVAELCDTFGARRAFTYRQEPDKRLTRIDSACDGVGQRAEATADPPQDLLDDAISSRSVVITDDAGALCSRAVLPITFNETTSGAICLERPGCGAFTDEDRYWLGALAAQVTLTLELSRRRRGTEPAEIRARAAEELRAVTDFADSVARDLDSVFGAIHDSVESAWVPLPEQQLSVLSTTEKARSFVRRLEAFARYRAAEPHLVDVNELILSLEPALRPLVRAPSELIMNLDPELDPALVDPWLLEQLLVTLTLNARRAMRGPGVVVVQSTNTVLDERASANRAAPGPYSMVSVATTGGEFDDSHAKEPSLDAIDSWLIAGYGTRIFAAGGYVSTHREPGALPTCRICLPARPRFSAGSGVVARSAGPSASVRLVGKDDDAMRSLARAFEHDGAFVSGSGSSDVVPHDPEIVVAEIDPASPELAQSLGERYGGERVLFLSDHPKGLLLYLGLLPAGSLFLQRPLSDAFVVARVRRMLADNADSQQKIALRSG